MSIADRLEALYEKSPLSMRAIGRALGHSAFPQYCSGATVPRIDAIPAIAALFIADPVWLAFGWDKKGSGPLDWEGFAKRLQSARSSRGIAQKDLGLPQMTVSHLEAGKHFPTSSRGARRCAGSSPRS